MTIAHIITLLATGAVAGFAGSLLGIGGAFIMTPVQHVIYLAMGLTGDMAIKLAFGTSLLVILPTVASGAWRHSKKAAVRWKAAFILGSCASIAAFGGATLAAHLSETVLRIIFGLVAIGMGIRMLTAKPVEVETEPKNNYWLLIPWAIPVGLLSGTAGVGGGIAMVPILMLALGFKMHNAVATSLGAIIFTSLGGVTGYMVNGFNVPNLPAYSIGYVYLPSWFLLAVTSVSMAQVGAITAHKLPAKQLEYIFVAVLFYVGLRMLGIFDWLGWPI
jgi:uncharacterized membrane protein YfcA